MADDITVIREEERRVVDFPGGATYKTLIGDDNGTAIPIRTGIQTSQPGYATRRKAGPLSPPNHTGMPLFRTGFG